MKKALIGLLAAGTLVGCGGNTYTITGKLDPGITDSVFLMQGNPENPTIASAAVAADGTFKIKGTIDQPDLAILTNRHRQGIGFIFLEPGKIDVKTADLGQFQVGGTRSNEIFQPINDSLGMLQGQFLVAMQENDMEKFDSLNQVANGIMRRALDNNSDNLVGVYFFGNLYNEMEPQEAREILNKFPEQMQKTQILTAIAKSIAAQENTEIGKPYLEIALPDSLGETVSVTPLIGPGKWVLIDFWATWCGPCREELSRVQKDIIDRFKGNEDFVFLPVSRGETRETVAAFREKMGYTFPMGLDPEQKIYRLYASNYIPRNFLIGKDGKVISATIGYEAPEFDELILLIERQLNSAN